jgi:hypothetical protein
MNRHLFSAFALVVLGCSTTAESDVERSEANQTIDPTGLGGLATVTIELPPSFQAEVPSLQAEFRFSFDGTPVTPGVPTKVAPRTQEGHWGTLFVDLVARNGRRLSRMGEAYWVAPGETLTVPLSLLKVWWSGHPLLGYEVDAAARGATGAPRLKRVYQDGRTYTQWATVDGGSWDKPQFNDDYFFFTKNDVALPVAAGRFVYSLGSLPPITIDVPPLQQIDVNADYHRFTGAVRVIYPDQEGMDGRTNVNLSCPSRVWATATGERPRLRILMDKEVDECTLEMLGDANASGISLPVELKAGGEATLELRRLNVRDVSLTDEPGTTVRGSFTVRRAGEPNEGAPLAWGVTGYGMDLPPGSYDVRVEYTANGVRKEAFYAVTL